MEKRHSCQRGLKLGTAGLLVGVLALGLGCAPAQTEVSEDVSVPLKSESFAVPQTDPYNPVVRTLSDGTQIQRTPNENLSASDEADANYHHPEETIPFNTYVLNADAKGCNACHEDLGKTLENMPYGHPALNNELGVEITVQMCLDCHLEYVDEYTFTNYGDFAEEIHGIHSKNDITECTSCHSATTKTPDTFELWDVVKHRQLRGIEDVAADAMSDDFSFGQDEVITPDALFSFGWLNLPDSYVLKHNQDENAERTEEMFNNWTITVSGSVDKETTFTLGELVKTAPSETTKVKMQCTDNPAGGPMIGQVEVTGIPMKWLLEQAGVQEGATEVRSLSSEGWPGRRTSLAELENMDAYLVYEMNGEPLQWKHGYPCLLMCGSENAGFDCKQVTDIIVSSENKFSNINGMLNADGQLINKPNVGIMGTREGQVVKTGEPYTLHGYADAFNERIVALEISMDKGATWKRFDTPETNSGQWVTWDYTFTPDQDRAYCYYVRAVSESGGVTLEPIEKMIVAKSDISESEGK